MGTLVPILSRPPGAFCPIPRCSRRSPAKRVRREEEEQGNERSFRRQTETEWSGLKANWPEGTREGGLGHCDDEPPWAKELAARRRRNTSAENPPSGPMRASGPTGGKTTGAVEAGPRPAKKRPGQKNLRMHRRGGGNIPTPLFTRLFDLCPFAVSPSDDGSLSQTQWVRRTRPLARRRASTLRPLRVAIRLRKPCSLERWRFLG